MVLYVKIYCLRWQISLRISTMKHRRRKNLIKSHIYVDIDVQLWLVHGWNISFWKCLPNFGNGLRLTSCLRMTFLLSLTYLLSFESLWVVVDSFFGIRYKCTQKLFLVECAHWSAHNYFICKCLCKILFTHHAYSINHTTVIDEANRRSIMQF